MTPNQKTLRFRRRRVFWGALLFGLIGVPALVWSADGPTERLMWALGVFMIGGVVWVGGLFVAFRCPRCGTQLGDEAAHSTRSFEWMLHLLLEPAKCPHCGLSELDE